MDNKFTVLDENGKESIADIITIFSYKEKEYIIYSIDKNENDASIFVSLLEKDNDGYDVLKDIEDIDERKEISTVVKEILSSVNDK